MVDSNTIVRVAAQIGSDIEQRGSGEVDEATYDHLYYADGYLYFEVTFSVCDKEYATRWGDGYRGLETDVYRRKLDDLQWNCLVPISACEGVLCWLEEINSNFSLNFSHDEKMS